MSNPVGNFAKKYLAIIYDTETHNKDKPRIIESAYGYVDEAGKLDVDTIRLERFNPGVDIAWGAMATHHILPEDIRDCPPSESFRLPKDVQYVIGHNVAFDMAGAAGCDPVENDPKNYKTICTLALGRKAWPEQETFTQSALFYMLHERNGLSLREAREFLRNAHSADADIQICNFIFQEIIDWSRPYLSRIPSIVGATEDLSLMESLHILSRAAMVPMELSFGKHKGTAPHLVPRDYKQWYMGTESADQGVVIAMTQGTRNAEEMATYKLAVEVFGSAERIEMESVQPSLFKFKTAG